MSTLRKAALICVVPLVFGAYSGLGSNIGSVSLEPPDSALVSQSGPSPIRLDQTADLDNVVYLMAAGSAHSPDLTVLFPDAFPKHFWVNNFNNTPQVLQWTVYSPIQADYHVEALISANIGETFDVSVFPPAEFTQRGTGDRAVLFDDWEMIITEIGQRYGDKLDGWFFDDGVVYYPAPFERMGRAARAGNPKRLISYNPWVSARVTDFQDVMFGEGHRGEFIIGSADIGGTGILTDGPSEGLLQHGMFMTENDWGIHEEDQPIMTKVTPADAAKWRAAAAARNVPISFTLMMWEDGAVSQDSLDLF